MIQLREWLKPCISAKIEELFDTLQVDEERRRSYTSSGILSIRMDSGALQPLQLLELGAPKRSRKYKQALVSDSYTKIIANFKRGIPQLNAVTGAIIDLEISTLVIQRFSGSSHRNVISLEIESFSIRPDTAGYQDYGEPSMLGDLPQVKALIDKLQDNMATLDAWQRSSPLQSQQGDSADGDNEMATQVRFRATHSPQGAKCPNLSDGLPALPQGPSKSSNIRKQTSTIGASGQEHLLALLNPKGSEALATKLGQSKQRTLPEQEMKASGPATRYTPSDLSELPTQIQQQPTVKSGLQLLENDYAAVSELRKSPASGSPMETSTAILPSQAVHLSQSTSTVPFHKLNEVEYELDCFHAMGSMHRWCRFDKKNRVPRSYMNYSSQVRSEDIWKGSGRINTPVDVQKNIAQFRQRQGDNRKKDLSESHGTDQDNAEHDTHLEASISSSRSISGNIGPGPQLSRLSDDFRSSIDKIVKDTRRDSWNTTSEGRFSNDSGEEIGGADEGGANSDAVSWPSSPVAPSRPRIYEPASSIPEDMEVAEPHSVLDMIHPRKVASPADSSLSLVSAQDQANLQVEGTPHSGHKVKGLRRESISPRDRFARRPSVVLQSSPPSSFSVIPGTLDNDHNIEGQDEVTKDDATAVSSLESCKSGDKQLYPSATTEDDSITVSRQLVSELGTSEGLVATPRRLGHTQDLSGAPNFIAPTSGFADEVNLQVKAFKRKSSVSEHTIKATHKRQRLTDLALDLDLGFSQEENARVDTSKLADQYRRNFLGQQLNGNASSAHSSALTAHILEAGDYTKKTSPSPFPANLEHAHSLIGMSSLNRRANGLSPSLSVNNREPEQRRSTDSITSSEHKSALTSSSIDKLNAEGQSTDDVIERFLVAYPSYVGTKRNIIKICVYITWLATSKRAPHQSLWDDFVRAFSSVFEPYIRQLAQDQRCTVADLEDLPEYIDIYNSNVKQPQFMLNLINSTNIDKVLSQNDKEAKKYMALFGPVSSVVNSSQPLPRPARIQRSRTSIMPLHHEAYRVSPSELSDASLEQNVTLQKAGKLPKAPFFETPSQLQWSAHCPSSSRGRRNGSPSAIVEETQIEENVFSDRPAVAVQSTASSRRLPWSEPESEPLFTNPSKPESNTSVIEPTCLTGNQRAHSPILGDTSPSRPLPDSTSNLQSANRSIPKPPRNLPRLPTTTTNNRRKSTTDIIQSTTPLREPIQSQPPASEPQKQSRQFLLLEQLQQRTHRDTTYEEWLNAGGKDLVKWKWDG